jgi:hypothetical protein
VFFRCQLTYTVISGKNVCKNPRPFFQLFRIILIYAFREYARSTVTWVKQPDIALAELEVVYQGKGSIRKNPDGTPFEFAGCKMEITKEEWSLLRNL